MFACSLGGGLVPTVDYIYGYLASTRFPIAGNWRKLGVSVAFCLQCSKRKQGSDILGGQGSTKKLLDEETKFPAVSCNAKVPLTLSKEQLQAESA